MRYPDGLIREIQKYYAEMLPVWGRKAANEWARAYLKQGGGYYVNVDYGVMEWKSPGRYT